MAKDFGTLRRLAQQVLPASMVLRGRRTLQGVSTSVMASRAPTPRSPTMTAAKEYAINTSDEEETAKLG
jgi:hypothetical protein